MKYSGASGRSSRRMITYLRRSCQFCRQYFNRLNLRVKYSGRPPAVRTLGIGIYIYILLFFSLSLSSVFCDRRRISGKCVDGRASGEGITHLVGSIEELCRGKMGEIQEVRRWKCFHWLSFGCHFCWCIFYGSYDPNVQILNIPILLFCLWSV